MKYEERCLLCKHSKVGDPCNTKLGLCFEKASKRDLTDRLTVYKIKVKYVNEQIEIEKYDAINTTHIFTIDTIKITG